MIELSDAAEDFAEEESPILATETLVLTEALVLEDDAEDAEETSEPAAIDAGAMLEAIKERSIELHLQPVFDLATRKVRYLEALTRLRTADDRTDSARGFHPGRRGRGRDASGR